MKIHLLSLLVLFFTINYLCAQSEKKQANASFGSLQLIQDNYTSEYFYLKSDLKLSSFSKLRKYDTISIYLKNKSNIILLQSDVFYKDTLIQDTIFQFFSTGYFRSESNFINIPTVYYYQSYGSCFGRYNYERIKNNLTKGKFNHFKDTFMIPIDSLNFALQLDYIESIGFIYYESNSDLRFNHTSIISGEKEWTITNNMGRIVQRGYLDASKGDNNYTILIYDLPKGNYTLEIGDRSDAVDESFTVR